MDYKKAVELVFENASYVNENKKICVFDEPLLRYLTSEQAEEWINIGKFNNVHSLGQEMVLIKKNIQTILGNVAAPLTIIDLGCGDGKKAAQFILEAEKSGYKIKKYCAVDINEDLLSATVNKITSLTGLSSEMCFTYHTDLEVLEETTLNQRIKKKSGKNTYLFLGNTFNNFRKEKILEILARLVRPGDQLVMGSKCRKNNSEAERRAHIEEYSSYGTSFTFTMGHLLGIEDADMKRIVKYNSRSQRIEIWIEINNPSNLMKENGLSDIRTLLVCCSYKPTIEEVSELLESQFLVKEYRNPNFQDVLFVCEKSIKS